MEAGLISKYFSEGHTYDVILDFLKTRHNIFLSLSTLKRKLKNAGLTRRTDYSPIETVNAVITHELTGSGQLLGYRALWQTLRQKYFLTVKRDDCVSEFGAPACLRTDCGTENGTMVAIHCALRAQHTDDFAGVLSHMYGTSTANQCIESWWSFFRKQSTKLKHCVYCQSIIRTQFWIDLFSDLRERHLFNGSHEHKCLLRYVFLGILQKDLMSTENFGITTPSDLFVSCLVILVNQKPCITCLTGDCGFPVSQQVIQEFEDILPPQRSLCGDGNLQGQLLNARTYRDRVGFLHQSTG
ncbi:Phasyl DNA replicon protein arp [Labeo rohita]|uniref:Phasyl DNA replicon protein arp n=1 Tax=Labeo rohita TaxID=84645 RepID=A0ABQ8L2M8_LABRO|nr:Phasyl DNA replicon protein arp [Labeo rohita]